jgi:hypothetical protein
MPAIRWFLARCELIVIDRLASLDTQRINSTTDGTDNPDRPPEGEGLT